MRTSRFKLRHALLAVLAAGAISASSTTPALAGEVPNSPIVLDVLRPQPVSLRPSLSCDLTTLQLHANRRSAIVVVNGVPIGQVKDFRRSRHALRLTPGTHQIELRRAGYEPIYATLALEGGKSYEIHYNLHRASS